MQPTIDLSVPPGHCGDLYPGRSTEHSDSGHNGFGHEGLVDPSEVERGEGYNSTRPSLPQELFPAAPPSCSPWVLSGGADDDLGQGPASSHQPSSGNEEAIDHEHQLRQGTCQGSGSGRHVFVSGSEAIEASTFKLKLGVHR